MLGASVLKQGVHAAAMRTTRCTVLQCCICHCPSPALLHHGAPAAAATQAPPGMVHTQIYKPV